MTTDFYTNIQIELLNILEPEQVRKVLNVIRVVGNDYDITTKGKELVVYSEVKNETTLKAFASCLLIEGRAKSTIKQYMDALRKLFLFTGKNFDEITRNDIRAFIAESLSRGNKKASANTTKNYISSFYKWAYGEELIEKNPASAITAIKCEKEIKFPFDAVEIDTMRKKVDTLWERAIFEFLLSSGVRLSEICSLNRSDVNLANLTVYIRHGKGGKDRVTYINRVTAHHLEKYLNSRMDLNEALFLGNPKREDARTKRISKFAVERMLDNLEKKSGVFNVHPHRFRRTFATNLHNRGMDLGEVQKLLGHSNIGTTMTYVYVDNDTVKSSYSKAMA